MKFSNKNIITKFSIFVLLILIGVVLSRHLTQKTSFKKKKKNYIHQILADFADSRSTLWLEGDAEELYENNKLNCPEYLKKGMAVHSSFFECNPLYYLCRTKESENFNGAKINFKDYQINEGSSFQVNYEIGNISFSLQFKDECRSIYLPKSLYNMGPQKNKTYLWDNMSEDVYIDKYYFNRLDLALAQRAKLENIIDPHKPILNYELLEMKKLCAKMGGQLLQNRYFDGAVNYPTKIAGDTINKYRYPWTKRREMSAIALEDKKALCLKSFNQGCGNFVYHSDYSASWIGIYHSLGSFMEIFDNKFEPQMNVKVSSGEVKFQSLWNENFVRDSLDETKRITEYNDKGIRKIKLKNWGFRCMYFE